MSSNNGNGNESDPLAEAIRAAPPADAYLVVPVTEEDLADILAGTDAAPVIKDDEYYCELDALRDGSPNVEGGNNKDSDVE
ncbi:MAG: hypothetical protein M3Y84_00905 [Acidobacteriota bacterium]|nr:hypothetical protein [Acidobacteriota bacterium]